MATLTVTKNDDLKHTELITHTLIDHFIDLGLFIHNATYEVNNANYPEYLYDTNVMYYFTKMQYNEILFTHCNTFDIPYYHYLLFNSYAVRFNIDAKTNMEEVVRIVQKLRDTEEKDGRLECGICFEKHSDLISCKCSFMMCNPCFKTFFGQQTTKKCPQCPYRLVKTSTT